MALAISKITVLAMLAGGNVFTGNWGGVSYGGVEEVGNNGVRHSTNTGGVPQQEIAPATTMLASYYGREFEGQPMASGQPYDADAYTAAHKSLPFGTQLQVSYGGESVRVTVMDRGPYVAGRDLDLSLAAAQELGVTVPGEAPVRVRVL
ncbi:MAG TPA: septal ring lytic transglycosylase RlpA family protein [Rubrobacter sp.]|nr:septal ring lytic transglycosylase RlpA family protein [Rubrobacter sp.]